MNRPFVPLVTAYALGVVLGCAVPLPTAYFVAALGALLVAGCALPGRFRRFVVLAGLGLAGWWHLSARLAIWTDRDLRVTAGQVPRLVTVRGTLAGTPTERVSVRQGQERARTLAWVDVTGVGADGGWQETRGRVVVTSFGALPPEYFGGRAVEVFGVLDRPRGPAAEGLFDYRAWLRWQGIYFELVSEGPADWRLAAGVSQPQDPPLCDRFLAWGQRTLARGLPEEDKSLRLLWAMSLGWKTALTAEVSEPFMKSGTMHIFAISGLHIAMITGIGVALLRVLQVPRAACGGVVIPFIWFYTQATGWQASAIRSALMMSIVVLGWALRRPSNLMNSLAGAGFLLLAWDPRQLFQAGFQLSFCVVLALAVLLPPLNRWAREQLAPDPMLPRELVPRWRQWLGRPTAYLALGACTSVASWAGSLPLVARYFHLVTPGGLVANLLVVPLSSLALASNLGSLVCGSWLPALSELFNHGAWFWMECMVWVCDRTAACPGAWFHVPSPQWPWILAYYGGLGLLLGNRRLPRRWRVASWTVALVGFGLGIGIAWGQARASTTLTVLALRSGSALVLDGPGRFEDLLIDAGDDAGAAAVVQPFLEARGFNRLPRTVLTHGDARHVNGLPRLARAFQAGPIAASPVRFRSSAYRRILAEVAPPPRGPEVWRRGEVRFGWSVLHPDDGAPHPQADDNALVLRRDFGGVRVLVLSDLGRLGQEALLAQGGDLDAEIVVASLPARGEPLIPALLDAIEPRIVLLQDAEYPAADRAGAAVRARIQARGIPVWCATEEGSITLRFEVGGCEVRTMAGRHWSLRAGDLARPTRQHTPSLDKATGSLDSPACLERPRLGIARALNPAGREAGVVYTSWRDRARPSAASFRPCRSDRKGRRRRRRRRLRGSV